MFGKKRAIGLVMLSMGLGMLIVMLLPGWGVLAAILLMLAGFWNMFT